jgi:RNA polymerase sigma-70 factor (ECF subfamily)
MVMQAEATRLSLRSLSDEEVVRRVRAGERELFEVLMRRHNQRIYRAVRSILKDEAEAEDAMQEAYVRAFVNLSQFDGAAAFSTWLVRIAINEALGRLRRRGRARLVADAAGSAEQTMGPIDPERSAGARELARLVEEAVDRLPEQQRVPFVLREVEALPTAEAAACLGISEEALKVRLHRARATLRTALLDSVGAATCRAFPFGAERCDRVVAAVLARIQVPGAS